MQRNPRTRLFIFVEFSTEEVDYFGPNCKGNCVNCLSSWRKCRVEYIIFIPFPFWCV